ncbi:MAG: magnesium transporter [Holosporales bacterium]|jgi:magnesium transporter|nr:magnesium transporter [Holosporales bacterium]
MSNTNTGKERQDPKKLQSAGATYDIEKIQMLLGDKTQTQQLLDTLNDMHEADLAELIEDLRSTTRERLITRARSVITADLLVYLNDKCKKQVLAVLGVKHIESTIKLLSNEDILVIVETLNENTRNEILSLLPKKREKLIRLSLTYPRDSIGRRMSTDFVTIGKDSTVYQAIEAISKNKDLPENFSEFFVVDEENRPIGLVALKDILNEKVSEKILSYMDSDITTVEVSRDTDEVATMLSKYKIVCAPVVESDGTLVGILRSDDILDIISEGASEGILDVGGIPSNSLERAFWSGCFVRLRWIFITVVNAAFTPLVIGCFKDVLKNTNIPVLMPLVASIGGVVGIQTVSVVIKEFADGSLREKNFLHTIFRETLTGLINGCVIGGSLGTIVTFYYGDAMLGVVLAMSMAFCMTWAAFIGSSLPILASKFCIDSALSSGPIVTTIADVSGFAIFLSLARLILP